MTFLVLQCYFIPKPVHCQKMSLWVIRSHNSPQTPSWNLFCVLFSGKACGQQQGCPKSNNIKNLTWIDKSQVWLSWSLNPAEVKSCLCCSSALVTLLAVAFYFIRVLGFFSLVENELDGNYKWVRLECQSAEICILKWPGRDTSIALLSSLCFSTFYSKCILEVWRGQLSIFQLW